MAAVTWIIIGVCAFLLYLSVGILYAIIGHRRLAKSGLSYRQEDVRQLDVMSIWLWPWVMFNGLLLDIVEAAAE